MAAVEQTGGQLLVERLRLEWRTGNTDPRADRSAGVRAGRGAQSARRADGSGSWTGRWTRMAAPSWPRMSPKAGRGEAVRGRADEPTKALGTGGASRIRPGGVARRLRHPRAQRRQPDHRLHRCRTRASRQRIRPTRYSRRERASSPAYDVPRFRASTDLGNVPMADGVPANRLGHTSAHDDQHDVELRRSRTDNRCLNALEHQPPMSPMVAVVDLVLQEGGTRVCHLGERRGVAARQLHQGSWLLACRSPRAIEASRAATKRAVASSRPVLL